MFVSPSNMFVNLVARGPLHVLSKFTIDEVSVTMCAIRSCTHTIHMFQNYSSVPSEVAYSEITVDCLGMLRSLLYAEVV